MSKYFLAALALIAIPFGYFFRAEFGELQTRQWLFGLLVLCAFLKVAQLVLQRHARRQLLAMSPEERQAFEARMSKRHGG